MGEPDEKVEEAAGGGPQDNVSFSPCMFWEPTPYASNGLPVTCSTPAASLKVAILQELAQCNSGGSTVTV